MLISALSAVLAAWAVWARFGSAAAIFFSLLLYVFAASFVLGNTMTESFAFPLANLSLAFFVLWLDNHSLKAIFAAFLSLTLALLARAGAFFILPALLMMTLRQDLAHKTTGCSLL